MHRLAVMKTRRVILFDSNETLLDISALDPVFEEAFGDRELRKKWFEQVVAMFFTSTIIGTFEKFELLADAAFDVIAVAYTGRKARKRDHAALQAGVMTLPVHDDVAGAVEQLNAAGFTVGILTNSSAATAKAQFRHAGVSRLFAKILSAGAVKRYKPSREAYEYGAKQFGIGTHDVRLVAAHGWDITGALSAGCKAAFVQRPEKALNPRGKQPDIIGRDLMTVARKIIDARG
ncbi:MAG: haloacid dehalogenase type II [Thermoanaerobaculia bacterium]